MFSHRDNCTTAVDVFLKALNVRHTGEYLQNSILSHPDHPSLLCISDTLEKYGIGTLAVKVDGEKLSELPLPCIVQLSDYGGLFKVLVKFSGDRAEYLDDKGKAIQVSKEKFLAQWTGICLLAETTETSKEPGIEKTLREQRTMSLLKWGTAILLATSLALAHQDITINGNAFFIWGYALLKLIGLIVGTLLLWYEVDKYNPTLQSFCSGGKKINCDAVLNSRYAKLFKGYLSLGLVGFSYFFGSFLYIAISGFSTGALSISALLGLAALPGVALSVYYQAIVIKQWCKFCIAVQAVLLLETSVALTGGFYREPVVWETLPLLLGLLLLPIMVWKALKPLLETRKETELYKRGLKKIKNNPDVLAGLLAKTRKISTNSNGLGILLTRGTAQYDIVKVCNPYCGPCAKAHPILEELVERGKINLQVSVHGLDR